MIKNNDETAIFDLSCNPKDSVEIIKYMRNIGVTNIDELLIYRIDIFFLTFEQFIKDYQSLIFLLLLIILMMIMLILILSMNKINKYLK